MGQLYPDSHVEIDGFLARYYEQLLNLISLGKYGKFIEQAIEDMKINPEDQILDMGSGSGYNAQFMSKYLGNEGGILGLDISKEGIARFKEKFSDNPEINVENRRVDKPIPYESRFDKVLTSFVIHGLPHTARQKLLDNAHKALRPEGRFFLLDYGEFELSDLPLHLRVPFKVAECEYAYDYLDRNWEDILKEFGFVVVDNYQYMGGFTRLLVAEKVTFTEDET